MPTEPGDVRRELPRRNVLFHSAVIFRLEQVLAVGGYRPIFTASADYELWLRLLERTEVANLPDLLAFYRQHRGQISSTRRQPQAAFAELARIAFARRAQGRGDPFEGLTVIDRKAVNALGLPFFQGPRLKAQLKGRWPSKPRPGELLRRAAGRLKRAALRPRA